MCIRDSNYTEHPEIKGVGLGLSIVKRITGLLHVKFKIESQIGEGTTVILAFNKELENVFVN